MKKRDLIAAALKEAGFNNRMVSIKERRGGYDWSFDLTIRDESIDVSKVKDAVQKFKDVDRCEKTGEVLAGGNTYISIFAAEPVAEKWGVPYYRCL